MARYRMEDGTVVDTDNASKSWDDYKRWLGLISSDQGQDVAEYAVMLAVILILVIGTVRLIGVNANNAFSTVASSLQ